VADAAGNMPGFLLAVITGAINVSLPHNDYRCCLWVVSILDLNAGFDYGLVAQLVRAHA
jgi:hypothetical protein